MARQAPTITQANSLPSGGNVASVHLEWQITFGDAPVDRPLKTRVRGPNNFIREFPVTTDSHFSTDVAGLPADTDVAFAVCSVFQDASELCSSATVHTQGVPGGGGGGPRPKPPPPRISSIEPHQATLHDQGNIVVRWTATTNFDQYHFIFAETPHGSTEVEINSGGTSGFFRVAPTFPGREYSFKVQGCITHLIGLNECSDFTSPSTTVMPQNTRSLREFLRLSSVRLDPGIRSLGPSAFSAGIRAMMHL
jgi:hypothetical protein